MLGLNRPIRDRRRSGQLIRSVVPAGHLAVCGRADVRDVVVNGMLWPTARK